MPALSFLALLALAVIFLPQEEDIAPLRTETTASDIVWSRITEKGETARMSADTLRQDADGIVKVQVVKIEVAHEDDNNLTLRGDEGVTDNTYEEISLSNTNGRLVTSDGAHITLSLATAVYRLDGSHLEGQQAKIHQGNEEIVADEFIWDSEDIVLRGNVQASYVVPAAE